MDRNKIQSTRKTLQGILDAARVPGLKISVGNALFDQGGVTFKVECREISADGTVQTREATEFLAGYHYTGFEPDDLGKLFFVGSNKYKLIGAKWGTKRPILAERVLGGQVYLFPADTVLKALGRKVKDVTIVPSADPLNPGKRL